MSVKYDVAIVTGWTNMGGSTESYINLTNALNDVGINTILIGPHKWHLDKCKSDILVNAGYLNATNIIWHFMGIDPNNEFPLLYEANSILSCHEHEINPVFSRYKPQIDKGMFDHHHFVSDWQLDWHLSESGSIKNDKMVIIPNLIDPTLNEDPPKLSNKIGGVIGSIDSNKQTHVSINNALRDGCDIVRVFGDIADQNYYNSYVKNKFNNSKVIWHGAEDDKNKMYGSVTDVYHYAKRETWGYIKAECNHMGIAFHSNDIHKCGLETRHDIINSWKEILI